MMRLTRRVQLRALAHSDPLSRGRPACEVWVNQDAARALDCHLRPRSVIGALLISIAVVLLAPTAVRASQPTLFAYVANSGSDSVSVINTSTDKVIATVPVRFDPGSVAITPNGAFAYVTKYSSESVAVIRTATNSVVANVRVGSSPNAVAITPNGQFAYVTNRDDSTVSVIRISTNAVVANVDVGLNPTGVAVTPDGNFAFVTNSNEDSVSVIRTATNTVVATVGMRGFGEEFNPGVWAVAVAPGGAVAYVTTDNGVSLINTATNTLASSILGDVGYGPARVVFTPDGQLAYVTNPVLDSVSVISAASNTVIGTTPTGGYPTGIAIAPNGAVVYVTNEAAETVSAISTATEKAIATVPVGVDPSGVAVTPRPIAHVTRHIFAPKNKRRPKIKGTVKPGARLKATSGTWTGSTPMRFKYQWKSCNPKGRKCKVIVGATTSEFVVAKKYSGRRLRVFVTATNRAGKSSASSKASALIRRRAPLRPREPTGSARWDTQRRGPQGLDVASQQQSSGTKAARKAIADLTGAVAEVQDRINQGPQKRRAAAKKAARTRAKKAKKRSEAAKKAARTRAKTQA